MELEIGSNPYSHYRSNAYWSRVHLDTRFKPDADDAQSIIDHLRDCTENPTRGLIARREVTKKPHYPGYYERNKSILAKMPEVKQQHDLFEKTFKKLYPKTGKARKALINNQNVFFRYVKPKMDDFTKAIFKFKLLFK